MAQLTHQQYDALERAISRGQRIAVWRRGTEYLVIPRRLRVDSGRELVEAVNPTTGDSMTIYLDTLDALEVLG
jgi:hypothetical protein